MSQSTKKETLENLQKLLSQYEHYKSAQTEEEKDRIGDGMTYSDPVVWMLYKHLAYKDADNEIKTFNDLKLHCSDHGGICAKRFDFLSKFVHDKYQVDINNSIEFTDNLPIKDFYGSDLLDRVVSDSKFIEEWQNYEYFKKDNKVAKWQNYLV